MLKEDLSDSPASHTLFSSILAKIHEEEEGRVKGKEEEGQKTEEGRNRRSFFHGV